MLWRTLIQERSALSQFTAFFSSGHLRAFDAAMCIVYPQVGDMGDSKSHTHLIIKPLLLTEKSLLSETNMNNNARNFSIVQHHGMKKQEKCQRGF